MAVHINALNGGNITITTGPAGHPETRFTLEGGTVETHNITGTLDYQWMIDNGYYDDENMYWIKPITQADIGNTVTSIGNYAFYGCSGLTSVTIPDTVTSIGTSAFSDCTGLTSVTIGNNVKNIGGCAFYRCSGLTSITIPDSVISFGEDSFELNDNYGNSLSSVTITANGGNAESVRLSMRNAGCPGFGGENGEPLENFWNMPS